MKTLDKTKQQLAHAEAQILELREARDDGANTIRAMQRELKGLRAECMHMRSGGAKSKWADDEEDDDGPTEEEQSAEAKLLAMRKQNKMLQFDVQRLRKQMKLMDAEWHASATPKAQAAQEARRAARETVGFVDAEAATARAELRWETWRLAKARLPSNTGCGIKRAAYAPAQLL